MRRTITALCVCALSLSCGSAQLASSPGPDNAATPAPSSRTWSYGLVIHGGAGTIVRAKMSDGELADRKVTLEKALRAGYAVLDGGGAAIDAVQAVITRLEDSPLFNAGKGSVFTNAGTIEMDASIMDGATLQAGAVAGVKRTKNPILAARKVMTDSPHVLLAGEGADNFAAARGLQQMPADYFWTEKRKKQLEKRRAKVAKHGTVGAVALDKAGNLAAGTSTGGMMNKRWGRVGDSPIIAAGTYAKNTTAAVSCTGHGEFFIRQAVAFSVSARIEFGKQSLQDAARAVMEQQLGPMGAKGGLIAIDRSGHIAMPYNTRGMYRGWMRQGEKPQVAIWSGDDEPRPASP